MPRLRLVLHRYYQESEPTLVQHGELRRQCQVEAVLPADTGSANEQPVRDGGELSVFPSIIADRATNIFGTAGNHMIAMSNEL